MPPRTVLHLINTGGPGGAETVCVNLVRGLDPERWRPIVVIPHPDWMSEVLSGSGIETLFLDDSSLRASPGYLFGLSRIISRRRVRLIHSHLFGPSVAAGALGLLRRLPVIATIHGVGDLSPAERFQRLKFSLLNRGADKVVFVSEALRHSFLDTGLLRGEITVVIPNGVDVDAYGSASACEFRTELAVADDEFLVGAIGNFRHAKGYDVFLRAAALLKSRASGYRFVIVGQPVERDSDGSVAESLGRLRSELGLEHDVAFAGFRPDIAEVLSSLDLFALTSRSEGFSISLVEAMASALPVVATRCGGPETIVDDGVTGLLVENGSPDALANAIQSLRDDPHRRRAFGTAARSAARDRFALAAQIDAYQDLYDRVTAESHE
jgi:glycosyltransferase involved in cell wall biosynthesis